MIVVTRGRDSGEFELTIKWLFLMRADEDKGWLTKYVEKISGFSIGTVVLHSMRAVMMQPAVSRPKGDIKEEQTLGIL